MLRAQLSLSLTHTHSLFLSLSHPSAFPPHFARSTATLSREESIRAFQRCPRKLGSGPVQVAGVIIAAHQSQLGFDGEESGRGEAKVKERDDIETKEEGTLQGRG